MDEEKSWEAGCGGTRGTHPRKECQGRVDFTLKGQLLHFNGFALQDARVVYQLTDELSLAGSFHVECDAKRDG